MAKRNWSRYVIEIIIGKTYKNIVMNVFIMKEILWAEMTMDEIGALDKETTVVIIPTGAIEGHGPHLPVDDDTFNATELAKRIATACQEEDIRVVVTPTLQFGYSEWMNYPGKLSLSSETYQKLVWDIFRSVVDNGFKKILVLNGHGGNPHFLAITAQDFYQKYGVIIPVIDYTKLSADVVDEVTETGFRHADEGETSVSLALGMDIDMSKATKETPYMPHETKKEKDILGAPQRVVVPLTKITERCKSGVMGDATKATKEKGEKIVQAVVDRTVDYIKTTFLEY